MKQIIATNKAPGAIGPYSQGTSCDKLVFTSGQLGIDPATGKLAGQSVEEQTMQALKNLGEVLKEGGADYDTVLKTTILRLSTLFMRLISKPTVQPGAALRWGPCLWVAW